MGSVLRTGRDPWFAILMAFCAAPVAYFVIARQLEGGMDASPALPALRPAFGALALAQLAAGAFLLVRAPRARTGAPPAAASVALPDVGGPAEPQAFQAAFVVASALVESCAILGFVLVVLGAPANDYVPFGLGTLAVLLGVGLPSGLRYWSAREAVDSGGVPPIA